jgi:hypothetical protein
MERLRLRFCIAWAIGVFCLGVAQMSHALEGRVIDGSTGRPLAGVYVIGTWRVDIPFPGKSASGCMKLEIVRTDEHGEFALSNWSGSIMAHLFGDETLSDYYYVKGYRWEKGRPTISEIVVMVPDTEPPNRQLDRIGELMEKADCGPWEDRRSKALPVYRLMYEEAQPLATSYQDRRSLSGMLFMIERLEVGEQQAQENSALRLYRGYQ